MNLTQALPSSPPDPAPSWISNRSLSWTAPHLEPGDNQSIVLQVLVNDTLADGALPKNCFTISSDELERRSPICIYTPVLNETRLEVTKKPLQKAVRRGEEVDYIIIVCNRGGQPATNITVRDVFDTQVELLSVWPERGRDANGISLSRSGLSRIACSLFRLADKLALPLKRRHIIYIKSKDIFFISA